MDKAKKELLKDSWFESYDSGVNKKLREIKKYINKEELKTRINKNSTLIQLFSTQIKDLVSKYSIKSTAFLLVDLEGVLIADYYDLEYNDKYKFKKGSYFTVDSCGTNAVSLSIKAKQPIDLKREEHYCDYFHIYESMAAPIKIDKRIIGYLALFVGEGRLNEKEELLFNLLLERVRIKMIENIAYIKYSNGKLNQLQKDVLFLSAQGYTISKISKELCISKSTVKYNRKKICEELCANNICQAIALGIKESYLKLVEV